MAHEMQKIDGVWYRRRYKRRKWERLRLVERHVQVRRNIGGRHNEYAMFTEVVIDQVWEEVGQLPSSRPVRNAS